MKKWYEEEYEFTIEVTGFLRSDHTEHYCRNGEEIGDRYTCTYGCPVNEQGYGICSKIMPLLFAVEKSVHWYLMMADSYYSKPQREEYFVDSGYYKFHEAYHLLKFANEKQILERAYNEYVDLKKSNLWGNRKYY